MQQACKVPGNCLSRAAGKRQLRNKTYQNTGNMQKVINVKTHAREGLYDITREVERIVGASGFSSGTVNVYVRGATAAIMIQENWDESVQTDVINLLAKLVPRGVWLHDAQDGNGDSHLKAGIIGPQETNPRNQR